MPSAIFKEFSDILIIEINKYWETAREAFISQVDRYTSKQRLFEN